MGLFQGDFDFTPTKGFILRVSAGVDLQTGIATWLLEAINPLTGLVITDPRKGLLPPNNAEGAGAGFVTYTVEPYATAPTGTTDQRDGDRALQQRGAARHRAARPTRSTRSPRPRN